MKTKVKKRVPTANTPCSDCYVCERGGTSLRSLGLGVYRHDDCAPGSANWCEWYDAHPEKHTDAGDILRRSRER